ncbi:hypothetical protein [Sphingomonas oligophenolica]|uniref:Uncharacterized protein n=1 Tax=Sphingomonas oligophenolica TaxID=301154 RepID=A0A502CL84_9SPHN|nr:hypothetical protein [Sphingomonas oligophenolica]TPG13678.1 hypothetical protein EAH84_05745 [Sphingomonas oligophenolica]
MTHRRPLRRTVDALPTGAFAIPILADPPPRAAALVTTAPPALPIPADAHGGPNPDDYDWVPVLRRRRPDGWSPDKQRLFVETLADTACVTTAAEAVGMSASSAYRLRRARDGAAFAAAWDAALEQGAHVLIATAFDRAIHGSEEPVFDRDGRRVGRRFRQNDRLLMFLLRKLQPERFGDAGRDAPAAGAIRARPPRAALADRIESLSPPRPADPAALLDADDLNAALTIADLSGGELPPWLRRRQAGDDALVPDAESQARIEARIEAVKRSLDPDADLDDDDDDDDELDDLDDLDDLDELDDIDDVDDMDADRTRITSWRDLL